jgi:hypothetical protein
MVLKASKAQLEIEAIPVNKASKEQLDKKANKEQRVPKV